MAGLGIASTRALCVIDSDTPVRRERMERGATVLRLARSHIRFGHFEFFHYSDRPELVRQLADYVIGRHFPDTAQQDQRYANLLLQATLSTATLVAHWQAFGFAHGVLNTDNMSILGDTFDYGPFGFLDDFDPGYICNHSDESGRYSFERQPSIGLWNLNALAHGLSTLIDVESIRETLQQYEPQLIANYMRLMRAKLGLAAEEHEDTGLLEELLQLLQQQRADYTRFFRALCDFDENRETQPLRDEFADREAFDRWARRYAARLRRDSRPRPERVAAMRDTNPKYILRNYLAQRAIEMAETGDYSEVRRLLRVLQTPYAEQPDMNVYADAPPDWGRHLEISCSS
jgi:uncharacterized protein YdiU (UPF0061 family)